MLAAGGERTADHGSNRQHGRVANHVYFSALVDTAAWGAELATALGGVPGRGHIYIMEPPGPFEDDPHMTDKRSPGNPTHSYPPATRCAWSPRWSNGRVTHPSYSLPCWTASRGCAHRVWT